MLKSRAKINKKDPSVSIWAVEMFKNVKQSYGESVVNGSIVAICKLKLVKQWIDN